jgi:hypothetical protein
MLTGTALHCRPQYGASSPAFGWSETMIKPSRGTERRCGWSFDVISLKMDIKTSFFDVEHEV